MQPATEDQSNCAARHEQRDENGGRIEPGGPCNQGRAFAIDTTMETCAAAASQQHSCNRANCRGSIGRAKEAVSPWTFGKIQAERAEGRRAHGTRLAQSGVYIVVESIAMSLIVLRAGRQGLDGRELGDMGCLASSKSARGQPEASRGPAAATA
jgi:hypothetical protein